MPSVQDSMFQEALSAIEAGERSRARDLLTRLLKTGKDNPDYWIWMSAVVETAKERTFCLKEALRVDPQNAAAKRGLSMMGVLPVEESQVLPPRYQRRNWQKAAAGEEQVIKQTPWYQYALMGGAFLLVIGIAIFAISSLLPKEAEKNYAVVRVPTATEILTETPTPPAGSTSVAAKGGATPLSLELEQTYTPTPLYVNTLHPKNESYRAGLSAYMKGNWVSARNFMEQLLTAEPGSADAMYYVGETHRMQEAYDKALKSYNLAIEMDPNFAPSYLGRARALLARNAKDLNKARTDLETAIDLDPNLVEAYLDLADLDVQAGQPADSLVILEQAIEIAPDVAQLYVYQGQAYLASGDSQKALASAKKAQQLDFTMLGVYRLMGEAMQQEGELAESLAPLLTYTRYETQDAEAWVMLALAQDASGDTTAAFASFDRALRLDDRLFVAHLRRSQILLERKDGEKALEGFKTALELEKDSFEANLGLGEAYMLQKIPGNAYMQLERTKALAKTDAQKAEVFYWSARSLDDLKEYIAALRTWRDLLKLPSASVRKEWSDYAKTRVTELTKLTPTVTLTAKASSTATKQPTATRQPTQTATVTPTKPPTRTPTVTETRVPTKTPTPVLLQP